MPDSLPESFAAGDADVVQSRREGSYRLYSLAPGGLEEVTAWVDRYSHLWPGRLDALETELARHERHR